jgi:EAL domain-containing protein (putative c-di-GMP-specific phosphodiesterase class I)
MRYPDDRHGQLVHDLDGAVQRGEIFAVYQPQFSLTTGRMESAEALSRWRHPALGYVSPAEFIPIAERSGIISQIGEHMVRLACRAVAHWQAHGDECEVAVNVSLLQLHDADFSARFEQAVTKASVDPRLITVEITESTAAADVSLASENLHRLASTGVTISIDDFGSGFSTREQVETLPASELKIDQSLVQDESSAGIDRLAAAVAFGKARHMRLVAEGVETVAQLERVRRLVCERAQGYFLGRPISRAELDARLGQTS